MALPAISGRWLDAHAKAKGRASHAASLEHRAKCEAIIAASMADRVRRLQSESDIKQQQEAMITAYFTRHRKVWTAAAFLLLCLWPAASQAQTPVKYYVPYPLPDALKASWDVNPTATEEYLLEVDGTRVSMGTASVLNPSTTASPAGMQSLPECNNGCRHFDVVLAANARGLLAPETTPVGVRTIKVVTVGPTYMENGQAKRKEAVSPAIQVSVGESSPTIPPPPHAPMNFIITFTGTGTIQVVP